MRERRERFPCVMSYGRSLLCWPITEPSFRIFSLCTGGLKKRKEEEEGEEEGGKRKEKTKERKKGEKEKKF